MKKITLFIPINAVALFLALLQFGCTPPPKPTQMAEFEAMRNQSYTGVISNRGPEYLEQSDNYYKLALLAYDDEELELCADYSTIGMIKYKVAETISKRMEVEEKLSEANTRYQKALKKYNEIKSEREDAEEKVALLEKSLALQTELKEKEAQAKLEQEKMQAQIEQEKLRSDTEQMISDARLAKQTAESVKAPEFAAPSFNLAINLLKGAEMQLQQGNIEQAFTDAKDAKETFEKAIAEAQPKYDEEQSIIEKDKMNKALFENSQQIFTPSNVRMDTRGVVVVIDSLFKKKKTEILDNKKYLLIQISTLMEQFPRYTILIEGYTDSKGKEEKNLSISQTRSQIVRDYFLQNGVPAKKMETAGYGEAKPFADNGSSKGRKKNNRVEIVFLFK